jgi:hypothetical protein
MFPSFSEIASSVKCSSDDYLYVRPALPTRIEKVCTDIAWSRIIDLILGDTGGL